MRGILNNMGRKSIPVHSLSSGYLKQKSSAVDPLELPPLATVIITDSPSKKRGVINTKKISRNIYYREIGGKH
jgi:hypothetical protein